MYNKKSKIPASQQPQYKTQSSPLVAARLSSSPLHSNNTYHHQHPLPPHSQMYGVGTNNNNNSKTLPVVPPPKSITEFVLENELPSLDAAVQRGEESLVFKSSPQGGPPQLQPHRNCCSHLLSIFPNQLCIELLLCEKKLIPTSSSDASEGTIRSHHATTATNSSSAKNANSTTNQHPLPQQSRCWFFKDPVSALHLQSQLEQDGSIQINAASSSSSSSSFHATTSQPLKQKANAALEPSQGGKRIPPEGETILLYGEEEERWNAIRLEGIPDIYHPFIVPSTTDQLNHFLVNNDVDEVSNAAATIVIDQHKRQKMSDVPIVSRTAPLPPSPPPQMMSNATIAAVSSSTTTSATVTTTTKPLPSPPRLVVPRTSSTGSSSKFWSAPVPPPPSIMPTTALATTTTEIGTSNEETNNGNNAELGHQPKPITDTENTMVVSTASAITTTIFETNSSTNPMEASTTKATALASLSPSNKKPVMDGYRPMPLPPLITTTSGSFIAASSDGTAATTTATHNVTIISNTNNSDDTDRGNLKNNDMVIDTTQATGDKDDTSKQNIHKRTSPVSSRKETKTETDSNDGMVTSLPSPPSEPTLTPTDTAIVGDGAVTATGDNSTDMMIDPPPSSILPTPDPTTTVAATQQVHPILLSNSNNDVVQLLSDTDKDMVEASLVPSPNDVVSTEAMLDRDTNDHFLLSDATFDKYYKTEEQIHFIQQNLLSTKRLPTKNKKSGTIIGTIAPTSMMMMMMTCKTGPPKAHVAGNRVLSSAATSDRSLPNNTNIDKRDGYRNTHVVVPSDTDTKNDSIVVDDMTWYYEKQNQVNAYSKLLIENFIRSRQAFWFDCKKREKEMMTIQKTKSQSVPSRLENIVLFRSELTPHDHGTRGFGSIVSDEEDSNQSLQTSPTNCFSARRRYEHLEQCNDDKRNLQQQAQFSEIKMQCLECSYSGYMESDMPVHSNIGGRNQLLGESIQHHFLLSNHKFGVTVESQPRIYCFPCGEYMQHEVFENEQHRIDISETLPWMAWHEYGGIYRSFDALQFVNIPDIGIIWKGMKATYPIIAVKEHILAARKCHSRYMMFHGKVEQLPRSVSTLTVEFTKQQQMLAARERYVISAPVGIYNLGNTCFMSAILHCLIHCSPLQRYFLHDVGHNHVACNLYRTMNVKDAAEQASAKAKAKMKSVCLACEMDKLFLRYIGSTKGIDLLSIVGTCSLHATINNPEHNATSSNSNDECVGVKGSPLLTADMLTAAWKCGGMNHLAGYEQRDAHEFLHGFLEILGKHMRQFRERVRTTINSIHFPQSFKRKMKDSKHCDDEIKNLFEGSLRSVLICLECGSKRIQPETFMSISLPLFKDGLANTVHSTPGVADETLDIETCLRHFTVPEMLTDPVMCPHCDKKTITKKQHVVSKLPKVLCLHLKRFDAATSKKIEDYVSFPSRGLNMGPFLPHWCEVSRVPMAPSIDSLEQWTVPEINYDLYATVNHFGNLQSGHYVSNVYVNNQWYHCNDSYIGFANEEEILRSQGAYLLFYMRR